MLPDRVSNPGPLTYKSGSLPIALRGPPPPPPSNNHKKICIIQFGRKNLSYSRTTQD